MLRVRVLICLLAFSLASTSVSAQTHPAAPSSAAFDQFKSLVGEWEGKDSGGTKMNATYESIVGGSVIMERLQPEGETGMVTMYTLDGDRIVVTHFCSVGNQPMMQTAPLSAATGKYDFVFLRVSGMKSPDELHMVGLTVTMPDKDHFSQVWTNVNQGKTSTNTINFTRKK
jgi:hypothetical protein